MTHRPVTAGCRLAVLAAALLAGAAVSGRADGPLSDLPSLGPPATSDAPRLPSLVWATSREAAAAPAATRRIRLFCIQPGFLCDTPGLEDDPAAATPDSDGDLDWVNFAAGNDRPFLDLRRSGDPGGVGYTRVHTQVQLFDTTRTACTFGLQAVTPAGLQFDGLPDYLGTTVLTPALSFYHALDEGTAIQAFVGKNLPLMNRSAQSVRRELQYGVAVQQPLGDPRDLFSGVYLSLGALGTMRRESDGAEGRLTPVWEVLPGLHYQMADNWWVSTALVLPVGPVRTETHQHWQVTCSLQF